MSPKTWMRTIYFQRYLKQDILARLDAVYSLRKVRKPISDGQLPNHHVRSMHIGTKRHAPRNGVPDSSALG